MDLSGAAIESNFPEGIDTGERFIEIDDRQDRFCDWIDWTIHRLPWTAPEGQ
jgi:hypothetical protein